ncbi:helix-turn-helix transcriptional regulator [Paenibacillus sp. MWE-103]|uniref:Helix-turn-helix transcriptional regulator n=1 Tax=Paenibacillus artemisiicola TaxID=1172618 RepID=A0ABS3WI95_9BACL|nr:helix-turn-helix transcriptional regulator [Paenibacillus artemisiicola]MBO7747821.1 helix-turn-helix transcriptional regulator [Paenibacillus artemisiicola]
MAIGNRISKLRDDRGWTQEQTAGMMGISRAALSHYEKNRREPDTETLSKFADLFKVSVDYLVGRTNTPHQILDEPVREFVDEIDQVDLTADDLLSKYNLSIDGLSLSEEEARRFIAFVRAERNMKKP